MTQYNTQHLPDQIHPSAWIAEGAVVVGDVTLHENVGVWFTAVLRGDTDALTIGANSNIQDGAVCHADPDFPLTIGKGVTIGHRAIVHGCTVGDNSLIGMGAIVLNGANIGADSIVGAGALVTQNKTFPERSLIIGSPAKAVRELTNEEIEANRRSANDYVTKAQAFKRTTS